MKKIMIFFGTRPEAIKMFPIIEELKKRNNLKILICVTGQHKELLQSVLNTFNIIPNYDFDIMKEEQSLFDITSSILLKCKILLDKEKPEIVLVHGDTTTAYAVSLSCFYLNIPVAHIEAGLRTYNIENPYPEEFNRRSISLISKYDFVPTKKSKENLINEGKNPEKIWVTGNTIIDTLRSTIKSNYSNKELEWAKNSKLLFITAHRRENIGQPMEQMYSAIRQLLVERSDLKAIFPVHKNPKVSQIVHKYFDNCPNIHLIEPLDVIECHNLLAKSYLVLTDSGGIQEEAAALKIPTLVMRNFTERPEGVESGILKLIGTNKESIYSNCIELIDDYKKYSEMKKSVNPFGDGFASKRIVDILEKL